MMSKFECMLTTTYETGCSAEVLKVRVASVFRDLESCVIVSSLDLCLQHQKATPLCTIIIRQTKQSPLKCLVLVVAAVAPLPDPLLPQQTETTMRHRHKSVP